MGGGRGRHLGASPVSLTRLPPRQLTLLNLSCCESRRMHGRPSPQAIWSVTCKGDIFVSEPSPDLEGPERRLPCDQMWVGCTRLGWGLRAGAWPDPRCGFPPARPVRGPQGGIKNMAGLGGEAGVAPEGDSVSRVLGHRAPVLPLPPVTQSARGLGAHG